MKYPKNTHEIHKKNFKITFALDFLELLHKRRQKLDKTDNLRQNTACSEQKFTPVLKILHHRWR